MLKRFPDHFSWLISACHLAPARAQDAARAFRRDLQRLAEILGTLHYPGASAAPMKGPKWRNEMQPLIDAGNPSGDRRARMSRFSTAAITAFSRPTVPARRSHGGDPPLYRGRLEISRDLTARYATKARFAETDGGQNGRLALSTSTRRQPFSATANDSAFKKRVPR